MLPLRQPASNDEIVHLGNIKPGEFAWTFAAERPPSSLTSPLPMFSDNRQRKDAFRHGVAALACILWAATAVAEPGADHGWAEPGDLGLRNDLQLLNDRGVINIPLTAWPVAWGDIERALADTDLDSLNGDSTAALLRVRSRLEKAMPAGVTDFGFSLGGTDEARIIRTFEYTPREDVEANASLAWKGERFAVNLSASVVDDPADGDEIRPDGTYLGVRLGNWMLSAGWQDRWWGPGRDGSLILSTNSRPSPGIGIQRIASTAPEWKWLRWLGPWTLTSFMNELDDERDVKDAWLWGFRASFRPIPSLEIGLSRTAQWCGEDRLCDLETFFRVLNGNDNKGANVDEEDEPGNQLAGIDMRWVLPNEIPVALYMQWIAEDTRRTGFSLRLWMQQFGIEHWGRLGKLSHRTHFEIVDTNTHLGALGEGSAVPDEGYSHFIFTSGYRYHGRTIGHGMDNDGLSLSLGSTLVDEAGNNWNITARYMEINRNGEPDPDHPLSPTPQDHFDIQVSHDRQFRFGRIHLGVSYKDIDDQFSGNASSGFGGFIRWTSQ